MNQTISGKDGTRLLPLKIWYPVNIQVSPYYELAYSSQFFGQIMVALVFSNFGMYNSNNQSSNLNKIYYEWRVFISQRLNLNYYHFQYNGSYEMFLISLIFYLLHIGKYFKHIKLTNIMCCCFLRLRKFIFA